MRAGHALAAGALVASTLVWAGPGRPAAGQPAPPVGTGALELVRQTPWVGAGGEFAVRVRVDRSIPRATDAAEVVMTVYDAVATRSEFVLNLDDRILGSPLGVRGVRVDEIPVGGVGEARLSVLVQDPAAERDPERLDLGRRDGVHPVRIVLRRADGGTVDGFTTHLVHLPQPRLGPRLGFALVLPLHAPPAVDPDGARAPPDPGLATTAAALEALRPVPFTLAPTPESVGALAAAGSEAATAAVGTLRRLASTHPNVSGTYVAVDPRQLVAANLGAELARQRDVAEAVLAAALGVAPDTRTWVAWEPLDAPALDRLARLGIDRIVVPEEALEPVHFNITLTRPFAVESGSQKLPAAMADAGLSSYFRDGTPPALAANHLLADLAVLYLDEPRADRRGVVALPPRGWRPAKPFLDNLVSGLVQNPVVAPASLDSLFADVLPEVTGRGSPLVRTLVPPPPIGNDGVAAIAGDLEAARGRLASLASIVGNGDLPLVVDLDRRLLVAQAAELGPDRSRRGYVRQVLNTVAGHVAQIRMPQTRSITLTAREADIPMTFQNRTGLPAAVVVELQSEKLTFPGGPRRQMDLTRLNTTERFPVVARTSGAFPLDIALKAPDGNLVIGTVRVTVRSTAASSLSVGISVGAAAFLAIWWGRHVQRGRRARRLVPA